jgi:hypothetical protein
MFETILDWILMFLELAIGAFFLVIWFMPKEQLDDVLMVEGDRDAK